MSIQQVLDEGRLIRLSWSRIDTQGRQLLCLYTALTGDPTSRPGACPASLAPKWLAYLLPKWDDCGTAEAWPAMTARVAKLAPRFGELTAAVGDKAKAGCALVALAVALEHAGSSRDVVLSVIALWRRVESGERPTAEEWQTAQSDAADAADAAAVAAADAAVAAADAADAYAAAADAAAYAAVADAAADADADAAHAAAAAVADAAAAAAAAAAVAVAAAACTDAAAAVAVAAKERTWDEITRRQLDVIEHALGAA